MSAYLEIAAKIAELMTSEHRWIKDDSKRAENAQAVVNHIHEGMPDLYTKKTAAEAASWWACFYERQCGHQSSLFTQLIIWAMEKHIEQAALEEPIEKKP